MIKYITSRSLWINMLIGVGSLIIIVLIFLLSLNWITKHGESRTVPAVVGKNIHSIDKFLKDKGFEIVVQDSVYYDSLPPGIIIKQVPEADDVVKINRTVYVTINRFIAPDIEMPNLLGSSYRNAEMVLKNSGLRIGDTSYRFDFAKNSVLEQRYKGEAIKTGTKIKMGSAISLVLGSGLGDEEMKIPDLIGMSYEEAKILVEAQGLVLGAKSFKADIRDSSSSFIYRQSPAPKTEDGLQMRIRAGQMIDIWLQVEKPVTDSTNQNNHTP